MNIQGSLESLQIVLFSHPQDGQNPLDALLSINQRQVLEKGGLRHMYLGSVACNRTLINIHFLLFRGAYTGHLPALRCVKMTSDHLDLFRIWYLGTRSIHSFACLQNRNVFSLNNKRGNRSRSLGFFCKNISLISITYIRRNINVIWSVKQINFCLNHYLVLQKFQYIILLSLDRKII